MANQSQALNELLARLRSTVEVLAKLQILKSSGGSLDIQVGNYPDAVISITVSDERKPSFCISYPELRIKRNGDRRVSTVTSDKVLFEGVVWVVKELAINGVVRPEFPD